MKKLTLFILFSITLISVSGCSSETEFNTGDRNSLEEMLSEISDIEEQATFLENFELVASVHGGEYKLNGFTINEINEESKKIKAWIEKENIKFLKQLIDSMRQNGSSSTRIHLDRGLMSKPKVGHIYKKSYSIEDLEKLLLELQR